MNDTAEILEEPSPPSAAAPRLTAVPMATLAAGEGPHIDIYLKTGLNAHAVLYRGHNCPANRDEIERLLARDVHTAYIREGDLLLFQHYLRQQLPSHLTDETQPVERRLAFLGEVARHSLREAFQSLDTAVLLREVSQVAEQMVAIVNRDDLTSYDVFVMLRHDYCLMAHAFNVAAFLTLLARALGEHDADTLRAMSMAGLMHDLGKIRVSARVLNKTGALTEAQRRLLQRHPQLGFERICWRDDVSFDQLMTVYQHHERVDGRGYPVGLAGNETHPWARMCAVVNWFDNRTTARAPRVATPLAVAIQEMQSIGGSALDVEMVECWTHFMQA